MVGSLLGNLQHAQQAVILSCCGGIHGGEEAEHGVLTMPAQRMLKQHAHGVEALHLL